MKIVAALFLTLAGLAFAQDNSPEKVKRLDSVTWDLNTHKLAWVVQTGTQANGEFKPESSAKYEVSPDQAAMMFADETRGLSAEEADSLHHLLDILSLYCAESTVWWDQGGGQGQPTQHKTTTTTKPEGKVVKIDGQQPAARPDAKLIAQAH